MPHRPSTTLECIFSYLIKFKLGTVFSSVVYFNVVATFFQIWQDLGQQVDIGTAAKLEEGHLAVPSTQPYTGCIAGSRYFVLELVDQVLPVY
jgi:hypothetical protein